MERALEAAGEIDAAVVGEPTNLDVATAQRGLMMVDLLAEGDQRHAGYASADGEFRNAALLLAGDLLKLAGLFEERTHPVLGRATATPTMLEAGVGRNVTPPVAKAVLDIRSTPDWTHEEIAELLQRSLASSVIVTSRRLVPCETPEGSRLLATALRVRPEAKPFGSPTCSDWVSLRHKDTIKCGPGTSRRSHTPDEYVDLPEVSAARRFYADLVRAYLAGR
jgi:acetylornithine deacetylase